MKYSKDFKEEELKLSDEVGVKKAVAQLGLPYYTLSDWRNKRKAEMNISSTGKCFDNSRMESFFATLKKEKLYQIPTYKMTKEEVKTIIYRYIFGYYNTIRVNSFKPGGWPPSVYTKMRERKIAA